MHSKHSKAATKRQKERFERMTKIGCLACRILGLENPGEVNHIVDGMKRKGHDFTYCLCPWHHRGVAPNGMNSRETTELLGPSRYHDGRAFKAIFGNDDQLLKLQNELIEQNA